MKNNPFSDIKKKQKKVDANSFIEEAKVDGSQINTDKNERRGSSYIDKETGEKIKLTGKVLQVPVNGYELQILESLAKDAGLPIGTLLRNLAMDVAAKQKR
ncbi:hypothetical protein [Vibrio cincinnatiensis]